MNDPIMAAMLAVLVVLFVLFLWVVLKAVADDVRRDDSYYDQQQLNLSQRLAQYGAREQAPRKADVHKLAEQARYKIEPEIDPDYDPWRN